MASHTLHMDSQCFFENQYTIVSPLAVLHFSGMMKVVAGSESLRNQAFEIIRVIAMDSSINSLIDLISCDVVFNLIDTTREPMIKQIVQNAVSKGNLSLVKIIMSNSHLQKVLSQNDISVVPFIDLHQIDITLDIFETLNIGKQLANQLFIYQYPSYNDKLPGVPPIKESIKFFPKALQIIQRESESICKYYDTQMLRAARFDLKETTFLKAKSKTKELNIAQAQTTIIDLCEVFKELFKNICFFFMSPKNSNGIGEFLQYVLDFAASTIPSCRSKPHPITRVILTFCDLIINTLQTASRQSYPFIFFINNLPSLLQIIKRDYDFITSSAQKGQVDSQISELYAFQRNLRFNIFKSILELNIKEDICAMVQFIVNDMLPGPLMLKVDVMPALNRALKFPIRDEALEMISYLLVHNEQHQFAVDEFIKYVSTDKFIDNERKLIQFDDNVLLIESSIDLINLILSAGVTLNENYEKSLRSLNQAIMSQYVRTFNPKIFDSTEEIKISPNKSDMRSSLSKSVRRAHIINPSVSRTRGFSVIGRRSYVSRK